MRALLLVTLLCACSAAAPTVPVQSVPVASDLPISCSGGRQILYSRRLPDGTRRTLELRCTDDRVTASSWITQPVPPDLDMDPTVASSGQVDLDRATFDRLWRAVVSGRCDRAKPTRSSLTVEDLRAKRSVTCADDDSWAALFQAVEPAVAKPSDDPQLLWPFQNEYWRDEIGYYRR